MHPAKAVEMPTSSANEPVKESSEPLLASGLGLCEIPKLGLLRHFVQFGTDVLQAVEKARAAAPNPGNDMSTF